MNKLQGCTFYRWDDMPKEQVNATCSSDGSSPATA